MPVKKATVNLAVSGSVLTATDSATGQPATSAGFQGEDSAVWLHCAIPAEWQDLACRLCVVALNGAYDESVLPVSNAIDMPLRQGVLVPGQLTVSLKGSDSGGVRKTADCGTLYVQASSIGTDQIAGSFPQAFEELAREVGMIVAGVSDYNALLNKPQIDGVTLQSGKSLSDLGAASQTDMNTALSGISTLQGEMSAAQSGISAVNAALGDIQSALSSVLGGIS
ncbi:MAG: hypothetical protein P4L75_03650 [Clostridia bacterium]|nr:hypothetical protein [Clostridia bacterium]